MNKDFEGFKFRFEIGPFSGDEGTADGAGEVAAPNLPDGVI